MTPGNREKEKRAMKYTDMEFFHQATETICGSLDINTVLERCLKFLQQVMPLESISLQIDNPGKNLIVNVAAAGPDEYSLRNKVIPFSREARKEFDIQLQGQNVRIVDDIKKHLTGRYIWEQLGKRDLSAISLKLEIEEHDLGVVLLIAQGRNRYLKEHAKLLEMLHGPFAIAMHNALEHREVHRLKDLLADDNRFLNKQLHKLSGDAIIGRDFGLKQVMEMVRQISPQKSLVMLLGETGVGKEVIANAIHYSSPRAQGPFIKVNCGAIPDNLIDSELFGYEKGAFTGALTTRRGRFERANGGTLFLDEIGELPLSVQVRLLRVLQNKEIERVGGSNPIPVDIRIITATHRNLPEMVNQGTFREDLWFRLNIFPITIPPLRERKMDIPALTRYFMERKAREMNLSRQPVLARGALERLQAYNWPGNVRELENLVERSIIRNMVGGIDTPLEFDLVAPDSTKIEKSPLSRSQEEVLLLDEVIKHHIHKVLERAGGKVQGPDGAARLLGTNPSTLRNKMKKLGIPYGRKAKQIQPAK